MEESFPVVRGRFHSRIKCLGLLALLAAFFLNPVSAHDATEITTRVYLRTNSMEIRVTMEAPTALLLLAANDHPVTALSTPADLENARPFLKSAVAELFQIAVAGKTLAAVGTNVELSVENHVEIQLTYPRPAAGVVRFDAGRLNQFPADEPYGVLMTVVDLANNVFLNQKLLTAGDPWLEVEASALKAGMSSGVKSP